MNDAPERIWAVPERNCTVYMSGNSPITAQDGPFTHHRHGAASEYIRADLVEALEAENQRLREALAKIADRPGEMVWGENSEVRDAMTDMTHIADNALAALSGEGET